MKTLRMIGMALFAVLMCVNFASCSSDDIVENTKLQKHTISLACVGEILDITHEPLSRTGETENNNIYEISVFTEDGLRYAYGSFKTQDNLTIDLLDGETYSFKVSYTLNSTITPLNQFNYSVGSSNNTNDLITERCYSSLEVYYGALDEYTPEVNGSVEINMKRMSFGLKLTASGLADGASLRTALKNNIHSTPVTTTLTSDNLVSDKKYTFYNSLWDNVYKGVLVNEEYVNYSEIAKLQIILQRIDGIEVNLGEFDILLERNKKTCVTIKIDENDSKLSNGIVIIENDGEITDGKEYEVDGDKGTIEEK